MMHKVLLDRHNCHKDDGWNNDVLYTCGYKYLHHMQDASIIHADVYLLKLIPGTKYYYKFGDSYMISDNQNAGCEW